MADYYSLLARAVANLPKTSPPSARRAIYERARKALTNQLRSLKPQLPESDIAREERALDEAVARLEREFEPATAEVHALPVGNGDLAEPPPAPPPEPPPAQLPPPPAPRAPDPLSARPVAPPARPTAPPPLPPRPPRLRPPAAPAAGLPAAPAAGLPSATAAGLPNATAFKGPLLGAAEAAAAAPPTEPPVGTAVRADDAPGGSAPPLGAQAGRNDREQARPILTDGRRKSSAWLWAGGAVAIGFAAVVAVAALLMRPALQDLTAPASSEIPASEPTETPEKSLRRVEPPAPAQTPSASPSAEASATPTPAAPPPSPAVTPSATPTLAPSPTATPTPTPTASAPVEAAPSAAPTVPIASRAAMLVATVADAAKPAISVGTAVWSIVPAPAGQPAQIGVKAEIDIPDLKLHASMIMRKNFDASLPASHTIDLRVIFDPGSPIKGVKDIALPLMRRDEPPATDALSGVRVKISDNYFLIGLNRDGSDVARNIQEIGERGWFDFPMQLDDDRIAKLTFEKGADGEKVVAQALAAWK